jgi:entry exclusion lipoprotein TrbK
MKCFIAVIVLLLTGCFGETKPEPKQISCDQASIDRQIIVASHAGCKRYSIQKDEMFQTCSFTCYESK